LCELGFRVTSFVSNRFSESVKWLSGKDKRKNLCVLCGKKLGGFILDKALGSNIYSLNGVVNEMFIKRIVVGMLQTNCYILAGEGCGIIIDPGDEVDRILEEVGDLKIDLILLTHNHFDHIGALSAVVKATSAEVAIHPFDRIDIVSRELKDGGNIPFDGKEISVIHTPGHTPGSCCFRLEEYLFSGDTLFSGGWGNTAFPGGSERAIFKSIREKLMSLPDSTIVYPGHGDSTTIGEERALYF